MTNIGTPSENRLEALSLEDIRTIVRSEGQRVKELGEWAPWMDVDRSLVERVPVTEEETAPGFDAGIACTLNLIPADKQKLSAFMHAGIKPQAIEQIRHEMQTMEPDSETVWWLAGCNVCQEGAVNATKFRKQIIEFQELVTDPERRVAAARQELQKMMSTFETSTYGVPFGTVDGCMQGAYIAGYPLATTYSNEYGIFFIGTYSQQLTPHLANYPWKNPDTKEQRGTSGIINPNFIKCADEAEFKAVLAHLKQYINLSAQLPIETVTDVSSTEPINQKERNVVHEGVQSDVEVAMEGLPGEFYYEKSGGLLKVDLSPSVDQVNVEGTQYIKKAETHMTLVPGRMGLPKIVKTLVVDRQKLVDLLQKSGELKPEDSQAILEKGPSNKQSEDAAKLALAAAAEGLSFRVIPRDEYRLAEKGESRTIIQMCEVEGADQYYRRLEELLGLPVGHIVPPPHHVTLFTREDGKAIGLTSQKELDDLTRPVSADIMKAAL